MDPLLTGYLTLVQGRKVREVNISVDVIADVDIQGRIIGIETLGRLPTLSAVLEVLQVARIPKTEQGIDGDD